MFYPPLPRNTEKSKGVDKAVDLVAGHDREPLNPSQARRIRNKIDHVVLPLLFAVYIREHSPTNEVRDTTPALHLLTEYNLVQYLDK